MAGPLAVPMRNALSAQQSICRQIMSLLGDGLQLRQTTDGLQYTGAYNPVTAPTVLVAPGANLAAIAPEFPDKDANGNALSSVAFVTGPDQFLSTQAAIAALQVALLTPVAYTNSAGQQASVTPLQAITQMAFGS